MDSKDFTAINSTYDITLGRGTPVICDRTGRHGHVHRADGHFILIKWKGDELPSGPYHPLKDLYYPTHQKKREPTALTEEEVERQSAIWQENTDARQQDRACFEQGLRWARDKGFIWPQPFSDDQQYTATLVNALRLSKEEMTRLVKDLIDRGAQLPKEEE